jgi:hypothetical protein
MLTPPFLPVFSVLYPQYCQFEYLNLLFSGLESHTDLPRSGLEKKMVVATGLQSNTHTSYTVWYATGF